LYQKIASNNTSKQLYQKIAVRTKNNQKIKMTNQQANKLTSILLDGKNYNMWVRQASFGLIGRDKIMLIVTSQYQYPKRLVSQPKRRRRPSESEKRMTIE
jgi:hypothetical protein